MSIFDNKIKEIVPPVYKDILKTNSNVIFVYSDASYEIIFDANNESGTKKTDEKVGCISLDINSDQYGMNIITPIMDRIEDFNLEYNDYAKVYIDKMQVYLSEKIDVESYKEMINLYCMLKNKLITILILIIFLM